MEKKVLWLLVVALLAVDVFLLVDRRQAQSRQAELRRDCAGARFQASYEDEEDRLLRVARPLPNSFGDALPAAEGDAVAFLLVTGPEDCTNCIEDEVAELNGLAALPAQAGVAAVRGFAVDEATPEHARARIAHLSPSPEFPFGVRDVLAGLPGATTPLVLVVRVRDGRILDVHKPIPEAAARRQAFYQRWGGLLGLDARGS